ncbi:MAG: phosphoglucosamine mutase [Alphaproteobacteria bacterium]|nr:phosphoglucosamine mutase [Alphaproteobacteria bacterium]
MKKKYFGTDGIRGCANKFPMTIDFAQKVAVATAARMIVGKDQIQTKRVLIGKDTRESGYMLEQALASGFLAMGVDVILSGPIPTPAVAMLTRSLRCDLGIMVSASHNPYQDNGIKLFGADGYKLSDAKELEIETFIENGFDDSVYDDEALGKASRLDDALGRYMEYVKSAVPRFFDFSGLKVVVDAANGAAYKIAPKLLWELEAEVIAIGDKPNGRNINEGCGATDTAALSAAVLEHKANIGIALDGDADRLIVVDEKGQVVDGDQLMSVLALEMHKSGELAHDTIVTTVMSNLGMEHFLASRQIHMKRTSVGDRYVMEEMRAGHFTLGGEQSGHIILGHHSTTGDGLLAAMKILQVLKTSGKTASEALNVFAPFPQVLKNVRYEGISPLDTDKVKHAIEDADKRLAGTGRVLVRASGTEPLIRVMAEGKDTGEVNAVVDALCNVIAEK